MLRASTTKSVSVYDLECLLRNKKWNHLQTAKLEAFFTRLRKIKLKKLKKLKKRDKLVEQKISHFFWLFGTDLKPPISISLNLRFFLKIVLFSIAIEQVEKLVNLRMWIVKFNNLNFVWGWSTSAREKLQQDRRTNFNFGRKFLSNLRNLNFFKLKTRFESKFFCLNREGLNVRVGGRSWKMLLVFALIVKSFSVIWRYNWAETCLFVK